MIKDIIWPLFLYLNTYISFQLNFHMIVIKTLGLLSFTPDKKDDVKETEGKEYEKQDKKLSMKSKIIMQGR